MQASCPHCGQTYNVSAELLGTQVQCSTCTKPFNIPAGPAAAAPTTPAPASQAAESGPVEVGCPHCEARFQAPPQLLGTSANCPTCQQSFVVEKADSELTLAPADDPLDPFGGLSGDPLGAPTSPLGANSALGSSSSALGGGMGGSLGGGSRSKSSSSSDNSGLWIGVAKILGGILMGIFGVVATMASYEAAREGESYTMYHGLVIGGVALFFYGVRDIYVHSQS